MKKENAGLVIRANTEMAKELNSPGVMAALLKTTFKGFGDEELVKQACLEAMMNGYTFQDIVRKKIYAIPYGKGYSLVESIANVRAKAMKSGQIGKSAPVFEEENGQIISCTVTVQKLIEGTVGDFTATVYFGEYYSGHKNTDGTIKKNSWGDVKPTNWDTKPRTMIAKVAEMHALRMAFPEALAKTYIEDEFRKEDVPKENEAMDRFAKAKKESEKLKMKKLEKKEKQKAKKNDEKITVEPIDDGIVIDEATL